MENASRALMISAGLLLTVLLFGAFLSIRDEIGLFQGSKVENKLMEENKEFNNKFEAYNKSFMYGTDIISVVSMAYNNNMKYYNEYPDQEDSNAKMYYVNIKVNIKEDITYKTIIYKYTTDSSTGEEELRRYTTPYIRKDNELNLYKDNASDMKNSKLYELVSVTSPTIKKLGSGLQQIKYMSSSGPMATSLNLGNYGGYQINYGWRSDFKSKVFICNKVEYSTETGRVNYMEFTQKPII
ncbi:MAG: hypothetical protein IKF52_04425 [Clostridia bacterium]|nr:hypothetical protein [Clostridia bacterium]